MLFLSVLALSNRMYEFAGQFMAYSLVHGGPVPRFLSLHLNQAICSGISTPTPHIEDVADSNLRDKLTLVSMLK